MEYICEECNCHIKETVIFADDEQKICRDCQFSREHEGLHWQFLQTEIDAGRLPPEAMQRAGFGVYQSARDYNQEAQEEREAIYPIYPKGDV